MMIMFSMIIMIIGSRGTGTCFHKMTKNKGGGGKRFGCAPRMCPWPFYNFEMNNALHNVGILVVRVHSLLIGAIDGKLCSIYYLEENLFVLIVAMCKAFK